MHAMTLKKKMYVCLYACNIYRGNKTDIRIGCHEKNTACMRMVSYNKCCRMKMKTCTREHTVPSRTNNFETESM